MLLFACMFVPNFDTSLLCKVWVNHVKECLFHRNQNKIMFISFPCYIANRHQIN